MYATCISCHAALGANEMLERFPVGRKLAIDATRGRLWVICGVCKQWNLSPIDRRWEAIEEGERLYRDARLRSSTDNIGLARLKDGSELIRVGEPLRPEFAAWRYGARFGRRWLTAAPIAGLGAGAGLVAKIGFPFLSSPITAIPFGLAVVGSAVADGVRHFRRVVELEHPVVGRVRLTQAHVETMRLLRDPDDPSGWHLRVQHSPWVDGRRVFGPRREAELVVHGADALRVATRLLPRINRLGGRKATVAEAVNFMERAGSAEAVFRLASRLDPSSARTMRRMSPEAIQPDGDAKYASAFARSDVALRLAVEMAAHEEQERALIAGELADLERQWKEAEEVAAIADGLLLSPAVLAQLDRLRLR